MAFIVSGLLNRRSAASSGSADHREGAPRQVIQKMKAKSFADLVDMNARTSPDRRRVGERGSGERDLEKGCDVGNPS